MPEPKLSAAARLVCLVLLVGCSTQHRRPLDEYSAFNRTPRVILPQDYVDYLRHEKFTHGELDHLPTGAIILHHDDVEGYLKALGYNESSWTKLQTGSTDPNVMYVVDHKFIVNRGLPGAGGISTQAAELAALGVKFIVHIGTAGLIGTSLPDRAIVISNGSYKDGAAVLLSDNPKERIADADWGLTVLLHVASARRAGKPPVIEVADWLQTVPTVGYTSPTFYYQPEGLVRELLVGDRFEERRPAFVEMEEAPLFETATRAGVAAASIVVGSDRYRLDEHGQLKHDYFESTREQELEAMRIAIDALTYPAQNSPSPRPSPPSTGEREKVAS